jgi:hypothetical protein
MNGPSRWTRADRQHYDGRRRRVSVLSGQRDAGARGRDGRSGRIAAESWRAFGKDGRAKGRFVCSYAQVMARCVVEVTLGWIVGRKLQ